MEELTQSSQEEMRRVFEEFFPTEEQIRSVCPRRDDPQTRWPQIEGITITVHVVLLSPYHFAFYAEGISLTDGAGMYVEDACCSGEAHQLVAGMYEMYYTLAGSCRWSIWRNEGRLEMEGSPLQRKSEDPSLQYCSACGGYHPDDGNWYHLSPETLEVGEPAEQIYDSCLYGMRKLLARLDLETVTITVRQLAEEATRPSARNFWKESLPDSAAFYKKAIQKLRKVCHDLR